MNKEEHRLESSLATFDPERLQFFSDAVFAIVITITILEIKVPEGSTISALVPLFPLFIAYAISFQTVGTYWNNHHHLFQVTKKIDARIMWANLHLLFWLSLIPFAATWVGENHGGTWPTAFYSFILLISALAYNILQRRIVSRHKDDPVITQAFRTDYKGIISLILYVLAIVFAFFQPLVSDIFIILVSLLWFLPERRIERQVKE